MAEREKKAARKKVSKPRGKDSASKSKGHPSVTSGKGKMLVVVESPAKAKTINRYLGNDYIVRASMGHIRDLPPSKMGVDVENSFAPTYEPVASRRKVLAELKKYARAAEQVLLATDLDREGEAIAWHLAESLRIPLENAGRVVFNEITPAAIREAFAHPRKIDMDKVNAQQARRILDRIVGYEISPLLWKKVARGLSAGRVQSVAVRLIVDREREIDAFVPEEYWRIGAIFTAELDQADKVAAKWGKFLAQKDEKGNGPTQEAKQQFLTDNNAFQAELARWKGDKFRPENVEAVLEFIKTIGLTTESVNRGTDPKGKGVAANLIDVATVTGASTAPLKITDAKDRQRKSNPPAPFTTATLQQTAAVRLHFSASRTMRIAQQLYEGISIGGSESVGLITYMRTDSVNLSDDAINSVRSLVENKFGAKYLPDKPRRFSSAKRAQEAHEAVRATDAMRTPKLVKDSLSPEQYKLYELIWSRYVACQMSPAVWNLTEVTITAETQTGDAEFKALGRRLEFDGYLKVAGLPRGGDQILPDLKPPQPIAPVEIKPTQHFTQPPPRFTEASLVKAMEADGIGRPSTYASIIKTIQDRKYVELVDRTFHPTAMGLVVTDKLVKHFPQVLDIHFTARMEDKLDGIEEGKTEWVHVLKEFYGPFHKAIEQATEEMVHAKAESKPSEYKCETCGKDMVYRLSSTGEYLACTGYPDCKTTYPVDREGKRIEKTLVDIACPKCGKAMLQRKGRFGPFLSCSTYPECDGVLNLDKKGCVKLPSAPPLQVDLKCDKCQAPMNLRRGKRGPWLSCSKYPKCRGRMGWKILPPQQQKQLETDLLNHEKANPQPDIKTMDGTEISNEHIPTPAAPE